MKKITFPVFIFLCACLLSGCAEKAPSYAPGLGGGVSPLNVTRDDPPAPEDAPPEDNSSVTDSASQPEIKPQADKIPMLMLGGELYCDTGLVSSEPSCGMMDGQISSSVEIYERPTEDGQSNFGSGYGYQTGAGGTIEIDIDGQRHVFQKRSEMRVRYLDNWFDAEDVSDETLRWLLWFNSLDEDTQMCVNYTPLDLYELCGYPAERDMPASDAEG